MATSGTLGRADPSLRTKHSVMTALPSPEQMSVACHLLLNSYRLRAPLSPQNNETERRPIMKKVMEVANEGKAEALSHGTAPLGRC